VTEAAAERKVKGLLLDTVKIKLKSYAYSGLVEIFNQAAPGKKRLMRLFRARRLRREEKSQISRRVGRALLDSE